MEGGDEIIDGEKFEEWFMSQLPIAGTLGPWVAMGYTQQHTSA